MAVIDVDGVGLQNFLELVNEGGTGRLNTQNIENFSDVVGVGAVGVDLGVREDVAQVSAFRLKHNVLELLLLLLAELLLGVASKHHSFGSLHCLNALNARHEDLLDIGFDQVEVPEERPLFLLGLPWQFFTDLLVASQHDFR